MSTLVEGFSWIIERPFPDSDVLVTDVVAEDGEELIRISGLDLPADFLSAAQARELAGVLIAAADELAPPG
jgi:hypothetical protein